MSAPVLRAAACTALLTAPVLAQSGETPQTHAPAAQVQDAAARPVRQDFEARLAELEQRLAADETELRAKDAQIEKLIADRTSSEQEFKQSLLGKWFQRFTMGGYTQMRLTSLLDRDASPALSVPADSSVGLNETFYLRRGRLKFSGDVSEHVYLYAQADYFGSVGGSGDKGLQARDLYADIALDRDKEYRIRAGLSKVPYGWVNMQSSQNRAPLERPDALNSGVEGERDAGVYLMWASKEARSRFKKLVKDGLKGSGDYGVLTFGAYTGQGPNRSDSNEKVHWIGRAAYPFQFDNGQFLELGVAGYHGDYVVSTAAIGVNPAPTAKSGGVTDERVGVSAILYPQPFGLEAEWTWGRGPELARDFSSIDDRALQGGYVQANYALETSSGQVFPFARWNFYDGGRKFGRNAPWDEVSELDLGMEWSPWPEIEVALMYTHTFHRTDTKNAPFDRTEDVDRLGFQLQWNY